MVHENHVRSTIKDEKDLILNKVIYIYLIPININE
jgi:hypothetical protein